MIRKFVVLLCATTVLGLAAGSTYAQKGGASTKNEFGVETRRGEQSAEGRAEGTMGTAGIAPAANALQGLDATNVGALATCNYWWLQGLHNWKWKGITGLYVSSSFNATSYTFFGGATNPEECGRPPLVVDTLNVSGYTYTSGIVLRINQTAYNVSSVSGSDRSWGVGSLAAVTCGALTFHTATKSGITWSYSVVSGSNTC